MPRGKPGSHKPGPGLWVLVTASRTWPDADQPERLYNALDACLDRVLDSGGLMTVMDGGARGGDTMATNWTKEANRAGHPVNWPLIKPAMWRGPCGPLCPPPPRSHRKQWTNDGADTCPRAGFYRNEAMVHETLAAVEPKVVLAFIHNGSGGATHCFNYAKDNGLDPIPFYDPPQLELPL